MYEYKVRTAADAASAEVIMNTHAKSGWRVVSVTGTHQYNLKAYIIITFEKEKQ